MVNGQWAMVNCEWATVNKQMAMGNKLIATDLMINGIICNKKPGSFDTG